MNEIDLAGNLILHEYPVEDEDICITAMQGLTARPMRLPPRLFYDRKGSLLFERITRQPEYYLYNKEKEIFRDFGKEISHHLKDRKVIIEPGSGNNEKIMTLLKWLTRPVTYVPVEISRDHLKKNCQQLARKYRDVNIVAIAADYMNPDLAPSKLVDGYENPLIFFPGSSIGNFEPVQAARLLSRFADLLNGPGWFLIGVDLKKDKTVLERAYNDKNGVTAAFNLNILHHINAVCGAGIHPEVFRHSAFYNEREGRIEMHLRAATDVVFEINGRRIEISEGETIHTENSYKYTTGEFNRLAERSGLQSVACWTDKERYFSLNLFSFED